MCELVLLFEDQETHGAGQNTFASDISQLIKGQSRAALLDLAADLIEATAETRMDALAAFIEEREQHERPV